MSRQTKKKTNGIDDLGKRLSMFRKARGLTQVEVAEKLGVSQAAVSEYESGGSSLSLESLAKVAKVLKVSADELLGLKPTKDQPDRKGRFWKQLSKVEELSPAEQKSILQIINGLVSKQGSNSKK